MRLIIGRKAYPVESYAQASAIWCEYRDGRDLGSSRSPRVQIVEDDGTLRNVSYNGRVWAHATGADWQPGQKPLYCPSQECGMIA